MGNRILIMNMSITDVEIGEQLSYSEKTNKYYFDNDDNLHIFSVHESCVDQLIKAGILREEFPKLFDANDMAEFRQFCTLLDLDVDTNYYTDSDYVDAYKKSKGIK